MAAPADLCVAWDRSAAAQRKALLELQQLGYASVAWTYEGNGRLGASHPRARWRLTEPSAIWHLYHSALWVSLYIVLVELYSRLYKQHTI